MFKHFVVFAGASLFAVFLPAKAQEQRDIIAISSEEITTPSDTASRKEVVTVDGVALNEKQQKRYYRQLRKDSIRARKNIWWSILGGPSYTPEASLGVGGAVLASFRMNKQDTISQRSFLPAGLNLSINGTIVAAGAGTFFFNENRFRIYMNYGYRNEPSHYYGKGFEKAENLERGDSTTRFHRSYFQLYPRFVWEVRPHFYLGGLFDLNYTKVSDVNPVMKNDPYYQKFKSKDSDGSKYFNVGIGGLIQYDTRDDVATPTRGMLLGANFKLFGKYLGGAYNYEIIELEYRHFKNVFRPRSTLAWIAKSQVGLNDVPLRNSRLSVLHSTFVVIIWANTATNQWPTGSLNTVICSAPRPNTRAGTSGQNAALSHGPGPGRSGKLLLTGINGNSISEPASASRCSRKELPRLDIRKEPGQPGMQVYEYDRGFLSIQNPCLKAPVICQNDQNDIRIINRTPLVWIPRWSR